MISPARGCAFPRIYRHSFLPHSPNKKRRVEERRLGQCVLWGRSNIFPRNIFPGKVSPPRHFWRQHGWTCNLVWHLVQNLHIQNVKNCWEGRENAPPPPPANTDQSFLVSSDSPESPDVLRESRPIVSTRIENVHPCMGVQT